MLADQFEPGFKCGLLLKDLEICRSLAQELDMSLVMTDAATEDYRRLVDDGGFDEDTSALIRLKRASERRRD